MKRIIPILLILLVFCRCAAEPSAETAAIRDQRHVLGMVLIEDNGKQLLEMVICETNGKEISFSELADRSICRNAFIDADGNSYYFTELTDKELKHQAKVSGYLKSAAVAAIPLVLGIVVGRHHKIVAKLGGLIDKKLREELLTNKQLAKQIAFWGGVIGAIVTQHRGNAIFWGKEDRKLISNWDEIFKIHSQGFEQPKELYDQRAIEQILNTIARRLSITVNPEIDFK